MILQARSSAASTFFVVVTFTLLMPLLLLLLLLRSAITVTADLLRGRRRDPSKKKIALALPIAFAFGLRRHWATLAFTTDDPLTVVIGRMDEGMSHLLLLGVPMFVLVRRVLHPDDGYGAGDDRFSRRDPSAKCAAACLYVLLAAMYLVSGISGSKAADMVGRRSQRCFPR